MYAKLGMLIAVFFILINVSTTQAQDKSDAIVGTWEMKDKSAKMHVFKSGNEYQAKLLWGKDIVKADGISKKDTKNPDPKLRNRDLMGIVYITGLKYDDDEWKKGQVYNNSNGKLYKCYVWIEDGELHLRGYLGMKILGQTSEWNRVK